MKKGKPLMDESASTGERLLTGYFDRFTIEHLHRYALVLEIAKGKRVLDIASGEGYGSNLLATVAKSVVGVDIDPIAVDHAQKKYQASNLTFQVGSTSAIPAAPGAFDLVVSFETLEHHDRHQEMYSEIKRVLRPNGVLLISTPNKRNFSDLTGHRNEFHVKELYLDEFIAINQSFFTNFVIFDQKLFLNSIVSQSNASTQLTIYSGNHAAVSKSDSCPAPTYHLCLASDSELPQLNTSIFDGTHVFESLETSLAEKSELVESLTKQLSSKTKVLSDLMNSPSYRIGKSVLTPFKKALAFIRRQQ